MSFTPTYDGPIRLLLLDVDGVLTDGTLYIGESGEGFKSFNVRDGLAVALVRSHGIRVGILSVKSSLSLDYRIAELGIDYATTGTLAKFDAYEALKFNASVTDDQVAYVGDDIVDLQLVGVVGSFYAPCDAHPLVLQRADVVVDCAGGRGVARVVAEHLLGLGGLTLEAMYEPMLRKEGPVDGTQ